MNIPSFCARFSPALAAAALAFSTGVAAQESAVRERPLAKAPPQSVARGLIVKLKDPAPAKEAALSAGAAAESRPERLQGVLASERLDVKGVRPVGRSAQLLDFGRNLSRAEAQRLVAQLAARPDVEWVEPNVREYRLQQAPNDPFFPASANSTGQWWLRPVSGSNDNVRADRMRGVPGFQTAWGTTTGGPSAVVAVLDTGIAAHSQLAGRVLPGYDMVSEVDRANDGDGRDADPSDPGDWLTQAEKDANPAVFGQDCVVENSSWHGSNIAGLIAAVTNDGVGVAGINQDGRILPVRVAAKCGADVADIVDGMRWAAGLAVGTIPVNPTPARIVNISFGSSAACSPAYQDAIDELRARGVVVIAAAGNESSGITRPASCNGVIAVGAANRDGFKADYSNFGAGMTLMTVGGDPASQGTGGSRLGDDGLLTLDIAGNTSPQRGDAYARLFGTSFSTPLASGTASLMLSVNSSLSAAQIIEGLTKSARPHVTSPTIPACSTQNPGRCICTTSTCGAGLLDAAQAVLYAQDPAAYVAPARQPAIIDNDDTKAVFGSTTPPSASTDSGGGGALGGGWLWALALAVAAIGVAPRRRR